MSNTFFVKKVFFLNTLYMISKHCYRNHIQSIQKEHFLYKESIAYPFVQAVASKKAMEYLMMNLVKS